MTLSLPPGCDYAAVKAQLVARLTAILAEQRAEIVRQTREIQRTAALPARGEPSPQVQLQFSAAGVEAKVRYPVHLDDATEIDERVSRELLSVLTSAPSGHPAPV